MPRELDEDDVRSRPGRGTRRRSRLRPDYADAPEAMVVAVDRGRFTCLVLDVVEGPLVVGGEDLEGVATDPEGVADQVQVVAAVLQVDELALNADALTITARTTSPTGRAAAFRAVGPLTATSQLPSP